MGGPKSAQKINDDTFDRGSCLSSEEEINFAVPSLTTLNSYQASHMEPVSVIKPGVLRSVLSALQTLDEKEYMLCIA